MGNSTLEPHCINGLLQINMRNALSWMWKSVEIMGLYYTLLEVTSIP